MAGKFTAASDLRRRAYWELELEPAGEDGTPALVVQMRKLDMLTLFLQGAVPTPLMAALSKMQAVRAEIGDDPTGNKLMDAMGEDDRSNLVKLLRRYACLAIKDPVVVEEDDGDPQHVPVEVFSHAQLLAIWSARPPGMTTPRLNEAQLSTFPGPDGGSDAPAVPDGEAIRPEAIIVDRPGGGTVEIIGA